VSLKLQPGVNILVGPNGAGKTNLIEAIRFLGDIVSFGAARAVARAGGPKRTFQKASTAITFEVETDYGMRLFRRVLYPAFLTWEVTITEFEQDVLPLITSEKLNIFIDVKGIRRDVFSLNLLRTVDGEATVSIREWNKSETGRDLFYKSQPDSTNFLNRRALYTEVERHISRANRDVREDAGISLLLYLLELDYGFSNLYARLDGIREYNILPSVARQPTEPTPYAEMRPDGSGVAEVIDALEREQHERIFNADSYLLRDTALQQAKRVRSQNSNDSYGFSGTLLGYRVPSFRQKASLDDALPKIKEGLLVGVRPLDDISSKIDTATARRVIEFQIEERDFGLAEVSDGTIKWLCLLVSIYAQNSYLHLLEEPENFLHPWLQQYLVEIMREQATQDRVFVITSHSSTILNASLPEEVLLVTPGREGTEVSRLLDQSEVSRILNETGFGIGDLWVSGAISGVPANE
jgi:predicted ATPase